MQVTPLPWPPPTTPAHCPLPTSLLFPQPSEEVTPDPRGFPVPGGAGPGSLWEGEAGGKELGVWGVQTSRSLDWPLRPPLPTVVPGAALRIPAQRGAVCHQGFEERGHCGPRRGGEVGTLLRPSENFGLLGNGRQSSPLLGAAVRVIRNSHLYLLS